jgi:uncharacterized membrane protein
MFNIDAKKRKAIYNIFAVMNAVVAALVPVAVQFQFIPVEWSENIIQAGAGVLSFVGFVLASRNVSVPAKTVDESLGYTPEGAVVIEA